MMNKKSLIEMLISALTSDIPFSITTYDRLKDRLVDLLLEE